MPEEIKDTEKHIKKPQPATKKEIKKMKKGEKKKSHALLLFTIGGLMIATAVGIASMQIIHTMRQASANEISDTSVSAGDITAASTIQRIQQSVEGETTTVSQDGMTGAHSYTPAGFDFAVISPVFSAVDIEVKEETTAPNIAIIESLLAGLGTKKLVIDARDADTPYFATFTSSRISCSITEQKPYGESLGTLTATCTNIADYRDTAQKLEPFFNAFKASGKDSVKDIVLSSLRQQESKTPGYATATINITSTSGIGGYAGLFYQTPDKKWNYFRGTQQVLPCDEYISEDLKKAYVGEACVPEDDTSLATVSL